MDAKDIVNSLNENDIFSILEDLDAEPIMTTNAIISKTICHEDGDSHKLYYYPNNRVWVCYTHHCKIGNIFNLIMRVRNCDFREAYHYVCEKFNIKKEGVYADILDMSFFSKFDKKFDKPTLKKIDGSILKNYYNLVYEGWLDEHISIETMIKYNILFSIPNYRIIIPHYDLEGNLIGIRRRNLKEGEVLKGKYMPEFINGIQYNHPLGSNLYGYCSSKKKIIDSRVMVLFEGEKSVLQLDGYNCGLGGVALCGSSLTDIQLTLLLDIVISNNIDEVVIGLDKEYQKVGDKLEEFYKEKIRIGFVDKLLPYVNVSVIWDEDGLLDMKDSPTDKGEDVWNTLFERRVKILD